MDDSILNFTRFKNLRNYYFFLPIFILSIFFKKIRKIYIQKKFFNRNYEISFFSNVYPPTIVVINNFNFIDNNRLLNEIYSHKKNNRISHKLNYHKNIFQSNHNLHQNKKFNFFKKNLNFFLSKKICRFFFIKNSRIVIDKLWFVISRINSFMHAHAHLQGDLSGVFYLQTSHGKNSGILKIYNPYKNVESHINIYKADYKKLLKYNSFRKQIFKNKIYAFKPKKNDLIIFHSYLMHSVENTKSISNDRISVPFDCLVIKN